MAQMAAPESRNPKLDAEFRAQGGRRARWMETCARQHCPLALQLRDMLHPIRSIARAFVLYPRLPFASMLRRLAYA